METLFTLVTEGIMDLEVLRKPFFPISLRLGVSHASRYSGSSPSMQIITVVPVPYISSFLRIFGLVGIYLFARTTLLRKSPTEFPTRTYLNVKLLSTGCSAVNYPPLWNTVKCCQVKCGHLEANVNSRNCVN